MSETRFHGVRSRENTDLQQAINDIDSSVIGIVAVADDADPETFPLNTPVLLTRVRNVLGKAGKTGSLYKALKAISDQCSPRVVIVRVKRLPVTAPASPRPLLAEQMATAMRECMPC
jgi:phage tail sheath protein FI